MKESILDMIGNTPILHIKNTNIYAKLECFNPTGSIKDRAARQMIIEAIKEGSLKPDSIIIEPTSGNTGIGLAAIGSALGYKVILTMPETMSEERRKLLKAYGATLVLTEGSKGMKGSIQKAKELAGEYPNAFIPSQFDNPNNPKAHYISTGPEIWQDMKGQIDILVAGIGTGGTLTGAGKFLKENNPNIKIVGVEPAASPILTKGYSGPHKIQGIGAGFIPSVLDSSFLDEVISVTDEEALDSSRDFVKSMGIFVGISSGAALFAARKLASRYPDKKIVAIFPDSGDRYLSTELLNS
ncbi:MAG: cysteine synthase A [Anaeroplasmataceae bacterium]|nr:cysteine synthase A [Anaeroplasmataceae bacterium]